jgi:hypothetical protein
MRQSRKQPRRVRGYRIHDFRGAPYHPPSFTTPFMWRASPPEAEWRRVIDDPTTQHAWIIQSGRKMRQFQFRRDQWPSSLTEDRHCWQVLWCIWSLAS